MRRVESSDDEAKLGRHGFLSTSQYIDDLEKMVGTLGKRLKRQ
jgi:hypothetical protein